MGNSCVAGSGRPNQGQSQEGIYQKLIESPSPVAQTTSEALQTTSEPRQTTFKWRIDGFSSLLDKGEGWTYSRVFHIRGLNWYLKLNPRATKDGDKEEYVSLKLEMAQPYVASGTVVEASFKFLIYDQSCGNDHEQQQVSHNFQRTSKTSGTSCMIPLTTLKEKSSNFLVNNCCVFGVEFIRVAAAKSNDVEFIRVAAAKINDVEFVLYVQQV
uniref:Uncharacterized protein n=1 Tax=Avena sativa TaxID=4498 RepID=A0ACD5U7S2_AVESA